MVQFNPQQIPKEFQDLVEARHQAAQTSSIRNVAGFHSHEVAEMSPLEHAYVIHHTAGIQRGEPEQRMLDLQRVTGGGLFSHSAEHIGDLTHRLNDWGGRFGTEFVEPKVRTQLHSLTHPYGYEREHMENMRGNAAYHNVDFEEYMANVKAAGETYSEAHEKVPVYNRPSLLGAWSAQSLGEMRFSNTTSLMHSLSRTLQDSTQFKHLMSQAGSVEFLKKREEDTGM